MAKDKITEYDSNASLNTVVGDVNLQESSMLPSEVNNAIREVMSHQKEAFGSGTPLFVDQTNNRVGVGTSSPDDTLHVNGDVFIEGSSPEITFETTGSSNNNWQIACQENVANALEISVGSADADASNDTFSPVAVFTSTGRLGLNDTAPNRLLQIKATGTGDTQKATIMLENEVGTVGTIGQGDSSNNAMIFEENGSERMRLDTNGNLLFNLTSRLFADASSTINASVESNSVLRLNRATSDGTIVDFGKDGTVVGKISSIGGERISIHSGTVGLEFNPSNQINPSNGSGGVDNTLDLGASGSRFDDIFATNGTIQTSDKNEKQDIEELTDAEKRVAVVAKGLMRKFRWKDKVAEKGDKARTHFGIIAQDLEDAFKAEGLDASKYAMFCSDTWTNDDGKEQTRLGIRYPQLLAFIITAI